MSYKDEREQKELENLFKDPKYTRKAWQSLGRMLANRPATRLPIIVDRDGNETLQSQLNTYTYNSLKQDIAALQREDKEPTELEMILAGQLVKARYDTQAATFVRDTLGAKPVDESKLSAEVSNPYEALTDEELELLAAHREHKQQLATLHQTPPATPIVEREANDAGYCDVKDD